MSYEMFILVLNYYLSPYKFCFDFREVSKFDARDVYRNLTSRCLHILSTFFCKCLEILGISKKAGKITICANIETTREKECTKLQTSRENFETFTATLI